MNNQEILASYIQLPDFVERYSELAQTITDFLAR